MSRTRYSCEILTNRQGARRIFEVVSYTKFQENLSRGNRFVPCGQTGWQAGRQAGGQVGRWAGGQAGRRQAAGGRRAGVQANYMTKLCVDTYLNGAEAD